MLTLRSLAADFGIGVTTAPDPALVDRNLAYTVALTNLTGAFLTNIDVTNRFPSWAVFVSATNDVPATVGVDGAGGVRYLINSLTNREHAILTVTVRPTRLARLTNEIGVGALPAYQASTNVVRTVFAGAADLGVSLIGPPPVVYVGDWVNYDLLVTNAGPDAAPGIVLSNTIPTGWVVQDIAPTNAAVSVAGELIRIDVGSLTAGASARWRVTARALNEMDSSVEAAVYSAEVYETNLVNNVATNAVAVGVPLSGLLSVSLVSTQWYNPQTGLLEQTARLVNTSSVSVAAARIVVADLADLLANAVGTNDLGPFVVLGRALEPGESVDLQLEYFSMTRVPGPDPVPSAFGIQSPTLPPPEGTGVPISRVLLLTPGRVLLEFPATPGRVYAVLAADLVTFTNTWTARPLVEAQADRVQWIDYGPPKTLDAVTNSSARFYRVLEVQP